jgi:type IV pilus assembly protein PilW
MTRYTTLHHQRGVTLIELMVTLAITLFLVAAAAYVYLNTRETQRAIDRNSSNTEVGTFALQLIGQEIMMAGFYPANISRPLTSDEGYPKVSDYSTPIKLSQNNSQATDWIPPTSASGTVYLSGLFGCDGAKFKPTTGECDTTVANTPDSIVINYFTNDNLDKNTGHRFDCTGGNIGNDPSNNNRLNTTNTAQPPLQPLFVSNRFAINNTKTEIEKQAITTLSLACNGNGATTASNTYQPLLDGIEDMRISYGVFAITEDKGLRTPEKFLSATEVNGLSSIMVDTGTIPALLPPWSRISAVRVCIMTKSQGAAPKIADQAGSQRSYIDCTGVSISQAANDPSLHKRFVQVFSVRNRLNQVF